MPGRVKVGAVIKANFFIVALLLVFAVTTFNISPLSSSRSSIRSVSSIDERVRLQAVEAFIRMYVGWGGQPPELIRQGAVLAHNDLAEILPAVHEFFRDAFKLNDSLLAAHAMQPNCRPNIMRDLAEAQWAIAPMLEEIRPRSPKMHGADTPLGELMYLSSISEPTLSALRSAIAQMNRGESAWFCYGNAIQDLANLRLTTTPRRVETDEVYAQFVKALEPDGLGGQLRALTPKKFAEFKDSRDARLKTEISDAAGLKDGRVVDWLPITSVRNLLALYSWIAVGSLVLLLFNVRRSVWALRGSTLTVDHDEPDFPANLAMPPVQEARSRRIAVAVYWVIYLLPALAGAALLAMQQLYASNLAIAANASEGASKRMLEQIVSSMAPGGLQFILVAATLALSVFVAVATWRFVELAFAYRNPPSVSPSIAD